MNFKNPFERQLFEAAERVCGSEAKVEHNKVLQIDVATAPEVASFVGPPRKEIDVITAGFRQNPFVKILISSKRFFKLEGRACRRAGMGGGCKNNESVL